ncbi:uncharacterized protein [Anabrus simplex]|uniref:uncharacterized protein n=1 Tax=Anabrus simplex TaxID=316456 RepID=UPI0035A2DFF0
MPSEQLLSEKEWTTVVRRELGDAQDFSIIDVDAGPLNDKINGFMGDHIRVVVTVSVINKETNRAQERTLKFFLKKLPRKYEFQTDYVISSLVFDKETSMYANVLQNYKEVLSDVRENILASANNDDREELTGKETLWSSKCLFTGDEVIVLEDLAEKGFRISGSACVMDFNHCVVTLRGLAAMHAASFIVEVRKRKMLGDHYTLLDDYSTSLTENFIVNEGENRVKFWFLSSLDALNSLVPHLTKYGKQSKHYQEVKQKFRATCENIVNFVKPSKKYKNVICHGDLWSNNIMFSYDEDQETPREVRFVDFQMVRYAPPATDVMMFLQTNTDREFRKAHLEELLKLYHEELNSELRRYGLDITDVLAWEVFRESCSYYQRFGRIMAALFHHFILLPTDILNDGIGGPDGYDTFVCGTREKEVQRAFCECEGYRHRLNADLEEIIESMILQDDTILNQG